MLEDVVVVEDDEDAVVVEDDEDAVVVEDDEDAVVRRRQPVWIRFIVVKTSLLRPLNADLLSFDCRLAFFGRD